MIVVAALDPLKAASETRGLTALTALLAPGGYAISGLPNGAYVVAASALGPGLKLEPALVAFYGTKEGPRPVVIVGGRSQRNIDIDLVIPEGPKPARVAILRRAPEGAEFRGRRIIVRAGEGFTGSSQARGRCWW